ncbi:hypothetical protein, conserved [Trypanosoma brucei gambiense DAL972]|uniref:Nop14-like protein n=1 Tax=Trypanosoma brucei gambiense (strain MHOM/CI/86/DAL972) TaxID=679716 RepID=C9ZJ50_TRYB9|nr:hypothetical protein, conserved [Trypanosoma brucei gambiense DAL972]CBH09408.1 hypothetical protein, conserved [Trypanosoma brucei gambiense DAL972]|eukprot:XP_011771714.1 hypothetical protein, conserved [Trypanosoma brucei gambiense DAL972]
MRASSANARLVQRHERQKAQSAAKASSARFNAKQSRFQLRQEEAQVRNEIQKEPLPISSAVTAPNRDQTSTFSRFDRPPARASTAMAATTNTTTTTTATFGLAPVRRTTNANAMGHVGTRTSRRAARFRLEDAEGTHSSAVGDNNMPEVGGLLGAVRRPRQAEVDDDASGDAGRKKTRVEKFQEVMANSKEHRAHLQREREQRSVQTKAIDQEFNNVLHLLERRDKVKEDREAFNAAGTPEVRALLQSFRTNHVAKVLSLRSDGSYTVAPLSAPGEKAAKVSTTTATAATSVTAEGTKQETTSFLDSADMELLRKVRSGVAEREVVPGAKESDIAMGSARPSRSNVVDEEANAEADEFDRMMQSMRLETRRAIAGDRTLTEEEQKQKLLEQELLEADRGAMPTISHNREQLTRAELLSRGGDFPEMGDDDGSVPEGELEDNLDISTAYDSDGASQRSDDDGTGNYDGKEAYEGDDVHQELGVTGAGAGGLGALEILLSEVETLSRSGNGTRSARAARGEAYHALLIRLYRYAQSHVLHTAQTFRALLIEAQRSFLRHGSLDRATLLLLHTTSRIFPMTDYRHAVTTPFFIFLCSTLLQMKLKTVAQARDYAVLAGLLCSCMLQGGKFCAEAIIAPLNLIALQVPRSVLEPARLQGICVPFPLVGRGDTEVALLLTNEKESLSAPTAHDGDDSVKEGDGTAEAKAANNEEDVDEPLLEGTLAVLETDISAERIVRYAYRLLSVQADALRNVPAFEYCLAAPFRALHERLTAAAITSTAKRGKGKSSSDSKVMACWKPSPLVQADHEALLEKLTQFTSDARNRRTPLAMRNFRPRPIRQFDPLLHEREDIGGDANMSTSVLKSEVRQMKRELREDRKRVVRHLQAEANVERRQRERAAAEVEAQRERKYRELMGSLQAQQHIMKTVDGLQAKARSKKRRSISGLPGKAEDNTDGGGA